MVRMESPPGFSSFTLSDKEAMIMEKIFIETFSHGEWCRQGNMSRLDFLEIWKVQQFVEYVLGIPARIVWEK